MASAKLVLLISYYSSQKPAVKLLLHTIFFFIVWLLGIRNNMYMQAYGQNHFQTGPFKTVAEWKI